KGDAVSDGGDAAVIDHRRARGARQHTCADPVTTGDEAADLVGDQARAEEVDAPAELSVAGANAACVDDRRGVSRVDAVVTGDHAAGQIGDDAPGGDLDAGIVAGAGAAGDGTLVPQDIVAALQRDGIPVGDR